MTKFLTLADGQDSIEVMPSNGSAGVLLIAQEGAGGGAVLNAQRSITGDEVDFIGAAAPVQQVILDVPAFSLIGNAVAISYKMICDHVLPIGLQGSLLVELELNGVPDDRYQTLTEALNKPSTPEWHETTTLTCNRIFMTAPPAAPGQRFVPGDLLHFQLVGTYTGYAGPPPSEIDVFFPGLVLELEDWTL